METIIFTTPNGFSLNSNDIDAIMADGLEEANYWIDSNIIVPRWPENVEYASEVIKTGFPIQIPRNLENSETDESEFGELNIAGLLKGIDLYLKNHLKDCQDAEDLICRGDCDSILQFACFDEIVYG